MGPLFTVVTRAALWIRSLTVAVLCGALPAPNRERERADGRSVEGVFTAIGGPQGHRDSLTVAVLCITQNPERKRGDRRLTVAVL